MKLLQQLKDDKRRRIFQNPTSEKHDNQQKLEQQLLFKDAVAHARRLIMKRKLRHEIANKKGLVQVQKGTQQ